MKKSTLKQMVEKILQDYPHSRDSDQWLTLKIWSVFYPHLIDRSDPEKPKVALVDILGLPREDNVKRYRAVFQNDLKMYPASPDIQKKRGTEESKRHKEFATNPLYRE